MKFDECCVIAQLSRIQGFTCSKKNSTIHERKRKIVYIDRCEARQALWSEDPNAVFSVAGVQLVKKNKKSKILVEKDINSNLCITEKEQSSPREANNNKENRDFASLFVD